MDKEEKKRFLEKELLFDDLNKGLWVNKTGFQIPKDNMDRIEIIIHDGKIKAKDRLPLADFFRIFDQLKEESNLYKLKLNKEWFYYPYDGIGRIDIINLGNFDSNSNVFLLNPNNGEEIYITNQDRVTLSKTIENQFLIELD